MLNVRRPLWDFIYDLNYGLVEWVVLREGFVELRILARKRFVGKLLTCDFCGEAAQISLVLLDAEVEWIGAFSSSLGRLEDDPFSYDDLFILESPFGVELSIRDSTDGIKIKAGGIFWKLNGK